MNQRLLFNLLQVLVVLIFAPLVAGVLDRLEEILQSKRGPSVFQPHRDLWKLFHKDEVVSEEGSWIFRATTYVAFVTPIFVTLLIPVLTSYPLFFAFMADMVGGGFVLALGGFFKTLAAVDTANPYGPMGAEKSETRNPKSPIEVSLLTSAATGPLPASCVVTLIVTGALVMGLYLPEPLHQLLSDVSAEIRGT